MLSSLHIKRTYYRCLTMVVLSTTTVLFMNWKCSVYDNRKLDKAQLSAAKIILDCHKTTSPDDVLADLNLTSLHIRREISLLRYLSKLIFDMVPCPFSASSFRLFKEFVPYALRHNQNVQIPLLKNPWPITSFSARLPACETLYHSK